MPYKSKAQAAYMHIHHPEIAAEWDAEYGDKPKPKKKKKGMKGSDRDLSDNTKGF